MKRFFYLSLGLILASCHNEESLPFITQISFKSSSSDKYGMMNLDGSILFEDEFENKPSVAVNGVFSIDRDGKREYYLASSRPKQINSETYIDGGYYTEGVIPVVKPESSISYINKEGKEVWSLSSVDNDRVTAVLSYFSDGLSFFQTAKEKFGYVNSKGEVVIKPIYDMATPFREGVAVVGKKHNNIMKFCLIDVKGKEIAQIKTDHNIDNIKNGMFVDGMLIVDNKILNKKGEVVFKVPSKWETASCFCNGYVVINHDDRYGIIDSKGDLVVRPKFNSGIILSNDFWIGSNSNSNNFSLDFMSYSGDKNGELDNVENVTVVQPDRIIVQEGSDYYFVDQTGKNLNNNYYSFIDLPYYYSSLNNYKSLFLAYAPISFVKSDYFPAEQVVASLLGQLNTTGVGNLKLGDTLYEVMKYYTFSDVSRYNYEYWTDFQGFESEMDIKTTYRVEFNKPISENNTFNYDAKIHHIIINIDSTGAYYYSNISNRLYDATVKYLKKNGFEKRFGNITWMNEEWDIYRNNNLQYLIAINKDGTKLCLEKSDE